MWSGGQLKHCSSPDRSLSSQQENQHRYCWSWPQSSRKSSSCCSNSRRQTSGHWTECCCMSMSHPSRWPCTEQSLAQGACPLLVTKLCPPCHLWRLDGPTEPKRNHVKCLKRQKLKVVFYVFAHFIRGDSKKVFRDGVTNNFCRWTENTVIIELKSCLLKCSRPIMLQLITNEETYSNY